MNGYERKPPAYAVRIGTGRLEPGERFVGVLFQETFQRHEGEEPKRVILLRSEHRSGTTTVSRISPTGTYAKRLASPLSESFRALLNFGKSGLLRSKTLAPSRRSVAVTGVLQMVLGPHWLAGIGC
jgi:hypothetical protein